MLAAWLLVSICLLSSPAQAHVAAGEDTFKAKCAECHGADGKGKEVMKTRDLASADTPSMSDADLSGIIGSSDSKAFKGMITARTNRRPLRTVRAR